MRRLAGALPAALLAALLGMALAACSALPDKPMRATLYDFGPVSDASALPQTPSAAIVLADIEAAGALDGSAILYRLGYADDQQLRPYSNSRWSASPPQLVRQRLRQQLGRDRPVLDLADSVALARGGGTSPRVLRIDLEEFSQLFDTQTTSWGLVRLRATLMENTAGGERLIAQRNFVVRQAAPSADATGGVKALALATDTAAGQIAQWLQTLR